MALYDARPQDLRTEQLDAFYAALIAKLMLVAQERISRHHIQFLTSELVEDRVDYAGGLAVKNRPAKPDGSTFRGSYMRMRRFEEALTAELSALRAEKGLA